MERSEVLQDVEWAIAGEQLKTAVRAGTQIPKCMCSLGKTKIDVKGCLMTL